MCVLGGRAFGFECLKIEVEFPLREMGKAFEFCVVVQEEFDCDSDGVRTWGGRSVERVVLG
jgi:hypothetical protein